jgi:hypothetical protein
VAGGRDIAHTFYPLQALTKLRSTGYLPDPATLVNVPTGYQASYNFTGVTGTSVEAAESALKQKVETTGLPVTLSVIPQEVPWYEQLGAVLSGMLPFLAPAGILKYGGAILAPNAAIEKAPVAATFTGGGNNMGLFDDIWGGVQSTVQGIFPTNAGIDWNNLLQSGVGLATQALAPRGSGMSMQPMQTSMAPAMSAAGAVARVGATVGRGFFSRFPNLATAIQGLRNQGQNVTRAKLYGVMKRFGPEFLVTGGLLTAAAVNELAVAGPGYRRMNPANVRALRRSVRRIESFHRLCKTTDRLSGSRKRRKC